MREPFIIRQYDKDLNILNEYEVNIDDLTSAIFSANIHAMRSAKNVEYFDIIDNSYIVMDDGSVNRWIHGNIYQTGQIPKQIYILPRYRVLLGDVQVLSIINIDTRSFGIKEFMDLFANMKNNIGSKVTVWGDKFKVTGVNVEFISNHKTIKTLKS